MSDLDRQVAEALGYKIKKRGGVDYLYMNDEFIRGLMNFNPSASWKQAGELLEKYNLVLYPYNEEWACYQHGDFGRIIATGTPQEAICKAVIALHKDDSHE